MSPEGFATILWKDGSRSEEAAELMKITSGELLNMGIVDKAVSYTHLDVYKRQAILNQLF